MFGTSPAEPERNLEVPACILHITGPEEKIKFALSLCTLPLPIWLCLRVFHCLSTCDWNLSGRARTEPRGAGVYTSHHQPGEKNVCLVMVLFAVYFCSVHNIGNHKTAG